MKAWCAFIPYCNALIHVESALIHEEITVKQVDFLFTHVGDWRMQLALPAIHDD